MIRSIAVRLISIEDLAALRPAPERVSVSPGSRARFVVSLARGSHGGRPAWLLILAGPAGERWEYWLRDGHTCAYLDG